MHLGCFRHTICQVAELQVQEGIEAKVHPWETCSQIAELAQTLLQAHLSPQHCSAERSNLDGLIYQHFRAVSKK